MPRILFLATYVVAICLFAPAEGHAQNYPQRPITVVVPYAAGGPTDVAIRIAANRMSVTLGQQIVIENVAGAGGSTGTLRVMRAVPDGYTLLANQTGMASMPALYPNLKLNVEKDLVPIGLLNGTYSFLVGRKSLQPNTVPELIAWMKGPGAPAKFAHPGVGTLAHLTCFIFASASGTKVNLIPYRGGGPAMNDLVGEQVDLLWAAPVLSNPLIETGRIKVFAGGAGKRTPGLQHVPTLEQVGFGAADILYWQGLFAPAGTPAAIVRKLNDALREALATPEVQKAYADVGTEIFPADQRTPEAAAALLHKNILALDRVVRENNIQVGP